MALASLKEALVARCGSGARYGLARMQEGLAALGHPERALPCVHVAGTNGKGSVCAMVEAMARAAGLRTATFTSPHLMRLAERVRIDGSPIGDEAFEAALGTVLADDVPWLTFFESITATFFEAARAAEVDLAVVEVGLGGRLDATNLIPPPRAAAVVSVGRDHTAILGDDLATIAREKAAIAKPGTPLVVGPLAEEALDAVLEVARGPVVAVARDEAEAARAAERDLEIVRVGGDGEVSIVGRGQTLRARPALAAPYQRGNVGVAAALGLVMGLAPSAIVRGLETAAWPGRFEAIERDGLRFLLDCAHNEDGAIALAEALDDEAILIFGAMADKAWPTMIDRLAPKARRRLYAPPLHALAGRLPADPRTLAERHAGECCDSPADALTRARALARPGERVVVAGSIFLVGALRALLLDLETDALVPM